MKADCGEVTWDAHEHAQKLARALAKGNQQKIQFIAAAEHGHVLAEVEGVSAASAACTIQEVGSVDPALISSVESLIQTEVTAARIGNLPATLQAALAAPVHARVVQEKSNRVIEMMLVTTKPWQIRFGKIVGIGLVGLLQYVVWLAGAGVVYALRKHVTTSALTHLPMGTIALMPVFFVLGYLLYASLCDRVRHRGLPGDAGRGAANGAHAGCPADARPVLHVLHRHFAVTGFDVLHRRILRPHHHAAGDVHAIRHVGSRRPRMADCHLHRADTHVQRRARMVRSVGVQTIRPAQFEQEQLEAAVAKLRRR
ncbi:ABC transporter permease [Alicyclobacillus acidiphilus]|uniref:ABC transporter permease n=1 Tax=Alicyclobacillus acidiphilus TaxID=182455 RepID=UPI00082E0FF0|nr:ABC transporter permease [Alicyclobacillus acidiphilus]